MKVTSPLPLRPSAPLPHQTPEACEKCGSKGHNNAQSLFGVHQIPTDNHIRDFLSGWETRERYFQCMTMF
jgi:hypothetical protein